MSTKPPPLPKTIDLSAIATYMAEVESFSSQKLGLVSDTSFTSQIQSTRLGLFRLVVMGEIKKGKSSFINALCGIDDLVPELSDVATSTIFKIRFGQEKKYTVFFRRTSEDEPLNKREIAAAEVKDYGTEVGNPNNAKNVEFIGVEAPSPALLNGLVIVDTPGVGGLFKEHRDITWRYAPNSDAIFFVTESFHSPIGAEEVRFLKDLRRVTNFIYFIQTMTDLVDSKAVTSRRDNNIEILINQVGIPKPEIFYFPVSSKIKRIADKSKDLDDLNDSGFVPLTQFLNQNLKSTKNSKLADIALDRTGAKLKLLASELASRKIVFDADSTEKQNAIKADIQRVNDAIEKWVVKDKPDLERQLKREFEDVVEDINRELKELTSHFAKQIQEGFGEMQDSELIYAAVPGYVGDIKSLMSEFIIRADDKLHSRIRALIEGATVKMGAQISLEGRGDTLSVSTLENLNTQSLEGLAVKATAGKGNELLKAGYYGANMWGAIGGTVGAIVGSVVPGVGTVIGSGIGVLIGSLWGGHDAVVERKAGIARAQAIAALNEFISKTVSAVQSDLKVLSRKLSDQASGVMTDLILQSQKKLAEQKKQIEARARIDSSSLKKEEDNLKALEAAFASLENRFTSLKSLLA